MNTRTRENYKSAYIIMMFCILAVALLFIKPVNVRAAEALSYMEINAPDQIDNLLNSEQGIFLDHTITTTTLSDYQVVIPERGLLVVKHLPSSGPAGSYKLYYSASKLNGVQSYITYYSGYSSPHLLDPGTYYAEINSMVPGGSAHHQWYAYFLPASKAVQVKLVYNADHTSCQALLTSPYQNYVDYSWHKGKQDPTQYYDSLGTSWNQVSGNTLDVTENGTYAIKAKWYDSGTEWDNYPFTVEFTVDDIRSASSGSSGSGGNSSANTAASGTTGGKSNSIKSNAGAAIGTKVTVNKHIYTITGSSTAEFTKAANKKQVTIPPYILFNGKYYNVTSIGKKAFTNKKIRTITIGKNVAKIKKKALAKSKATVLILKTRNLTKKNVKGSLKQSIILQINTKVGNKKDNKTYVKKYKKFFTKKNAGRTVAVK